MKFVGLVLNWYIVNIFNDKMILFLNFYLFQVQIKLSFVLYPTLEALEFFSCFFNWQNYVCMYAYRHAHTHTTWQFNHFLFQLYIWKWSYSGDFLIPDFTSKSFYPAFLPFAPCPILLSYTLRAAVHSFSMLALGSVLGVSKYSDSKPSGGGCIETRVILQEALCSVWSDLYNLQIWSL